MRLTDFIIPLIISFILIHGLVKGVDVFNEFLDGAKDGLMIGVKILPALVALMTCMGMFKASGALDVLTYAISPLSSAIGFPPECVPLALLRPLSGSGALVLFEGVLSEHGPDSFIGRVASVLMGSTETTFYTIAIYFGVTKVTRTRQCLAAAITADFAGFIASAITVRLFLGI